MKNIHAAALTADSSAVCSAEPCQPPLKTPACVDTGREFLIFVFFVLILGHLPCYNIPVPNSSVIIFHCAASKSSQNICCLVQYIHFCRSFAADHFFLAIPRSVIAQVGGIFLGECRGSILGHRSCYNITEIKSSDSLGTNTLFVTHIFCFYTSFSSFSFLLYPDLCFAQQGNFFERMPWTHFGSSLLLKYTYS